jgi:hypothetical protein
VRQRAAVVQQVEALAKRPGDGAAGCERLDAISEPSLSYLCAFLQLLDDRQRRLDCHAHACRQGRAVVADHQVQQSARHLVGAHIHPDVRLGSVDTQLLLDLGLILSRAGRTICCARVTGVEVQCNHGDGRRGNSHPSLSIHIEMLPSARWNRGTRGGPATDPALGYGLTGMHERAETCTSGKYSYIAAQQGTRRSVQGQASCW